MGRRLPGQLGHSEAAKLATRLMIVESFMQPCR